jgi:hypothetical protein
MYLLICSASHHQSRTRIIFSCGGGGLQDKSTTIVKGTSYTLLWKEIGLLYTLLHKKFYF